MTHDAFWWGPLGSLGVLLFSDPSDAPCFLLHPSTQLLIWYLKHPWFIPTCSYFWVYEGCLDSLGLLQIWHMDFGFLSPSCSVLIGEIQKVQHSYCCYHLPKVLAEQSLSKTTGIPRKKLFISLTLRNLHFLRVTTVTEGPLAPPCARMCFVAGGMLMWRILGDKICWLGSQVRPSWEMEGGKAIP